MIQKRKLTRHYFLLITPFDPSQGILYYPKASSTVSILEAVSPPSHILRSGPTGGLTSGGSPLSPSTIEKASELSMAYP